MRFVLILIFSHFILAQSEIATTLSKNESLRSIAKKYFNNADDWEIILHYNGYKSPDEIHKNARLIIPIAKYKKLNHLSQQVDKSIRLAGEEGAGLLAKRELEAAEFSRRQALDLKRKGELLTSLEKIDESLKLSKKALKKTKEKRVKSITALLNDKKGSVQSKRSKGIRWKEAEKKQLLYEKERLRSKANSYGQIQLLDGSFIRLGENSLAVIETLRQNVLNNESESDIIVLEGDVSSNLSSLNRRNKIKVRTPGTEANIRSSNFWTSRDRNKVVRIANYNGEIDLKASGKSITLKKNEGSKIIPGQAPSKPKKLLPAPTLLEPKNEQSLGPKVNLLKWQKDNRASAYRLQIARDRDFKKLLYEKTSSNTFRKLPRLKNGSYFWRVASLDADRILGQYSAAKSFTKLNDVRKPYLKINKLPKRSKQKKLDIKGQSNKSNQVFINKEKLPLDSNGTFNFTYILKDGQNSIQILARDSYSNESRFKYQIEYKEAKRSKFFLESDPLYTNQKNYFFSYSLEDRESLFFNGEKIASNEHFHAILQLKNAKNELRFKGRNGEKIRQVILDQDAPKIDLSSIPRILNAPSSFTIQLSEKSSVFLNSEQLAEAALSLSFRTKLKQGKNRLNFSAQDLAGNIQKSSKTIIFDDQKPVFRSKRIRYNKNDIEIQILAEDKASGLKSNCKLRLSASQQGKEQIAQLRNGVYQLRLPISNKKIKIEEIQLSDKAGNLLIKTF